MQKVNEENEKESGIHTKRPKGMLPKSPDKYDPKYAEPAGKDEKLGRDWLTMSGVDGISAFCIVACGRFHNHLLLFPDHASFGDRGESRLK